MRSSEEAITLFRQVHGDRFDYAKYEYRSKGKKSVVICREHGDFEVSYNNHRSVGGNQGGCPGCKNMDRVGRFLSKVRKYYGNQIDTSLVKYIDSRTPVTLLCRKHGKFTIYPCNVKPNSECRGCQGELRRINTAKELSSRFRLVHGDRFDYSKVVYSDMHEKVIIGCPQHGDFEMTPANHISNHYCWKCNCNTASRKETAWIESIEAFLGIRAITDESVTGQKGASSKIDAVFGNVAVEYDGAYWHSLDGALIKDESKTSRILYKNLSVIRLRAFEPGGPRLPDVPGAINIHVPEKVDPLTAEDIADRIRSMMD